MEQRRLIASDQSTMNNHQDHHHSYHPQNQQQPPNNSTRRVMKSQENTPTQVQAPAPQKCPRCDSMNTKFCYYNNYSLSQPRYFCKACRRYWTHGGNLRNVPVGGGCRKSKRPKPSSSSSSTPSTNIDQISRTHIQSLAASSALSSSTSSTLPAFASQSFTGLLNPGGVHQNLIRVTTNPLAGGNNNNTTNMYPSATVGGFFSSFGTVPQPVMPPQSGLASGNNQLFGGGNMALFQGMNFQNLKAGQVSTYQQMIINPQGQSDHDDDHHHEFVGSQFQQRPLNSWAQGFINNNNTSAGTTSTTPSTSGFWISGSVNVGNQSTQQAGTSSINPNQWSGSNDDDDKNQGFDPSR